MVNSNGGQTTDFAQLQEFLATRADTRGIHTLPTGIRGFMDTYTLANGTVKCHDAVKKGQEICGKPVRVRYASRCLRCSPEKIKKIRNRVGTSCYDKRLNGVSIHGLC